MDKRIRSPNYPALSLREAIDKISVLYKSLHTHSAPREVIAKGMGYQSLNGASATAISALHKYGLLERVGDEIKISERAMRLLHPHSPDERTQALREAAAEPQLFAELAERFPGAMPSEELLRNYLVRKGFAPQAVSNVVLAYRETQELVGREAGAYDSPDIVPAIIEVQRPMQSPITSHSNPGQPPKIIQTQGVERALGQYDFEDGSYVRIVAGGPVQTETALTMAETLIGLKRAEIKARTAAPATAPEGEEKNKGGENDPFS